MTDAIHPLVPPATPLLELADSSLRIGGLDGADGLLVTGGGPWLAPLVRGLDGRRSTRTVLADAAATGLDPVAVHDLLDGLRSAGLRTDVDPADLLAAEAGPAARSRTAVELPGTLGAAPQDGGRSPTWRARRAARVVVDGATRVGAPLASVLAASGIGRLDVRDRRPVASADAVVGGVTAQDEGRLRSMAAADAVRRVHPTVDLRPLDAGELPDLVVLCRPWAAVDPLSSAWQRAGVPHLVATMRGEAGVVGPLVVPGLTSCLRCGDLHRRDADHRWPEMAAQLTAVEPPPSGATLTCLATALTAALQVLAHVDGGAAPAALEATIELRLPDLVPRRRSWPPHPACGCAGSRTGR
ncbi:thiamine biosynthesis protein ThiF [Modestobacter sp. I12A-02628]|uniref:Thiamine biosynthesis protein ThiF n=1 Tax=Goekera deserti TaxID=2497753 RepID=A0A7K3W7R8_9ACTN|nr:ThiF family adenylyltransferase [Goekera deserti]MPQ99859.1 thiamine biosynthesis protein ThiF [Goekera deserti]NDI50018.1 thiamine biosynthesis protein ThiF [Goekera deserti]NEL52505.1 thiamine biosynthesis protein ThiF [Goekera deserti]